MAGKSVPKVKQKLDKKDLTLSLAFLLPAILITVIFVIYPVFDTVGLSFRKWNGMFGAAKQWVGLENYQKIFSDKLFWNAMLNSVYFMIGGFVILMPLSFGLAMLVTAKIKGTGFFRTCYFLPNMLGTTAVALYVIAILWTVVTLFPVVVTVMASFKTNSEIYLNLLSFPKKIMFQNYISANKTADALNTIKNSLVVATLTTVFNTVVGMMAAYILSRKDYKFLKWVYVFFMIGVMVPVHCTLIPINNIATALNAKNNLFFLILIYVAFGMSQAIFLYTGFMDGISRNLDEAAIIDGCNNWQLLWKILFPVCKPIIATEAIFVFIYGYSELVFSMILMTDTKYFTVSRAMLNFSSAHTQEIGSQFAYVVMSVIPMLIIYIVFHKQIEKGMLSGAIKG